MNPIRKHTNQLFASKGCDIDSALSQAQEIIEALPSDSKAAAYTALMVFVNTAANAFDQAQGPSPEKLAVLDLIRNEIDNWASSNLDQRIEDWVDNNIDIGDKVQDYLNDNIDIENSVNDWINDNLEDKINDMDLVVRIR